MKYHDGNVSVTAAEAISQFARVVFNASGQAALAGGTNNWDGVAMTSAATGELIAVQIRGAPGTTPMIASAAITRGNPVYPSASGKVGASPINGTGPSCGKALEAASGDNAVIEVAQIDSVGPGFAVTTYTASAADDTANQADVDTGLGVNPAFVLAFIRATGGIVRTPAGAVSFPGSVGVVRVADANLAVNEQIVVISIR